MAWVQLTLVNSEATKEKDINITSIFVSIQHVLWKVDGAW